MRVTHERFRVRVTYKRFRVRVTRIAGAIPMRFLLRPFCALGGHGASKQMFVLKPQVFVDGTQYVGRIGTGFGTSQLEDRIVHAL